MNYRKLAIAGWIATGILVLMAGILYVAGYRVTLTPSLPRGIYRQMAFESKSLKRGDIVSFCPSDTVVFRRAKQRGYIPSGICPGSYMPLFKPIVAMVGDVVTVTDQGILINGKLLKNSQSQYYDHKGRPMVPMPTGSHTVKAGFIWLVSGHNVKSFDSRYFGAVSMGQVTGVMQPVWVEL